MSCDWNSGCYSNKKSAPIMPPAEIGNKTVNCCIGQNLPGGGCGYCAPHFCPGTTTCKSTMSDFCKGPNLKTNECQFFCKSNLGFCDSALRDYCGDPKNFNVAICGCALPKDQYISYQIQTADGQSIPIKCDKRCGASQSAIPLLEQGDCKIGAICIVNAQDVNVNAARAQLGVKIDQSCGNTKNNDNGKDNRDNKESFYSKNKYVIWIIVGVLILVIIGVIAFLLLGKKNTEDSSKIKVD